MVYIAFMSAMAQTGEHAADVLATLSKWQAQGEATALVIVTRTEGGAVRAPGALLAVSETSSLGYISGGCIDADVKLQARQSIERGEVTHLRYGAGSPFVDLPLPCGGAIEITILPRPDERTMRTAAETLARRIPISLQLSHSGSLTLLSAGARISEDDFVFGYAPKLQIRIAGRGEDALALATIATSAGYDVHLQVLDDEDVEAARECGVTSIETLITPAQLADVSDDPWTAFVLLFHDRDWEVPLLQQALRGPAFYIGAVGSRRTHQVRCDALREASASEADINRIVGPIGLVPSLRDASMLAISTLAEIIDTFPGKPIASAASTAVLMLAAGASSRFEAGDKLLAQCGDQSVLERAASIALSPSSSIKIAVTNDQHPQRATQLRRLGWQVINNPDAHLGQATSLKAGLDAISTNPKIDQVLILLADMPYVSDDHLNHIQDLAQNPALTAIMSEANGVLYPPALFKRRHFDALAELTGDRGAKSVFEGLEHGAATASITPQEAIDIDRVSDLTRRQETVHA
ncbi:MAG: NTP transferase domain-containing protein [Hyphomonadaceae bacterium]|nr:NTP transferase domain-containing protein [Hyphomonadaceae bacterium]